MDTKEAANQNPVKSAAELQKQLQDLCRQRYFLRARISKVERNLEARKLGRQNSMLGRKPNYGSPKRPLLSRWQIAVILGVSESWVGELLARGRLQDRHPTTISEYIRLNRLKNVDHKHIEQREKWKFELEGDEREES